MCFSMFAILPYLSCGLVCVATPKPAGVEGAHWWQLLLHRERSDLDNFRGIQGLKAQNGFVVHIIPHDSTTFSWSNRQSMVEQQSVLNSKGGEGTLHLRWHPEVCGVHYVRAHCRGRTVQIKMHQRECPSGLLVCFSLFFILLFNFVLFGFQRCS